MSIDPIRMVAMQRLIRVSASIEVQLTDKASPLVVVLQMAREEAAAAVEELVKCDSFDPDKIRNLQNKIVRFDDLVGWLKDIVKKGFEYDGEISREDHEEFADMIGFVPDGSGLDVEEALEVGLMERTQFDA
jgi:hypothetical protein